MRSCTYSFARSGSRENTSSWSSSFGGTFLSGPKYGSCAGRHNADALAFEHREMRRAEIENDMADVAARVRRGEAEIAGDRRLGRMLAVEQIDLRFCRRSRRLDRAAGAAVRVLEQRRRLVVHRLEI